ncbi:hypothetical protein CKF58_04895 [Psittacicella hinzii]|uniref:Uncharacterized protein n=1 Tax=Psittacicella hinzii TaxID=2028575 RepID=A0A3A1YKE6_9GAMM|nr:hypothetical protein CKF58_04895 [Psittacicella hinzii]
MVGLLGLALAFGLTACKDKDPYKITGNEVSSEQFDKFILIYTKYQEAWGSVYTLYNMFDLGKGKLLPGDTVKPNSVIMFYMMLNAPDVEANLIVDHQFNPPALKNFKFAHKVCLIAKRNGALQHKIAAVNEAALEFCDNTNYYYSLFIKPFTPDQIKSVIADIYRNKFSPEEWQDIERGKMGFNYQHVKDDDLWIHVTQPSDDNVISSDE